MDCLSVVDKMYTKGVSSVLDYSVEGKEEEAQFDAALEMTLKTVEFAKERQAIPFAVFKPTGLGRLDLYTKVGEKQSLSDRVGRMADTLEFSNVALPKARFSQALVDELRRDCPSLLEEDENEIVIRHAYIERRMKPLNLYLDSADEERRDAAVKEYGDAIKELAYANIFPGDMLFKNFGVTRFGRVVFYDYDEIEYMTDCNFRRIPPAPNPEAEMSGEPWYSVARNDVFPEEFGTFLLGNPETRRAFLKHHADLLEPEFWQLTKQKILDGFVPDFFPYPEEMRFCRMFAGGSEQASPRREAEAA